MQEPPDATSTPPLPVLQGDTAPVSAIEQWIGWQIAFDVILLVVATAIGSFLRHSGIIASVGGAVAGAFLVHFVTYFLLAKTARQSFKVRAKRVLIDVAIVTLLLLGVVVSGGRGAYPLIVLHILTAPLGLWISIKVAPPRNTP